MNGGMLVALAVLGLIVGSFLGVVIDRLPRGESILFPRSHCPNCRTVLGPLELVPVLSYLVLRGRCRTCRVPIPLNSLLVELLTAGLFVALPWAVWPWMSDVNGMNGMSGMDAVNGLNGIHGMNGSVGVILKSLFLAPFLALAVALSWIDIRHRRLPNALTLPAIAYGGLVTGWAGGNWWAPVVGAIVGGGMVVLIVVLSRGGMGLGDAKWLAAIGSLLTWKGAVVALFTGAAYGAAVGLLLMATHRIERRTPIPFGPFLSLGALSALFFPGIWPF